MCVPTLPSCRFGDLLMLQIEKLNFPACKPLQSCEKFITVFQLDIRLQWFFVLYLHNAFVWMCVCVYLEMLELPSVIVQLPPLVLDLCLFLPLILHQHRDDGVSPQLWTLVGIKESSFENFCTLNITRTCQNPAKWWRSLRILGSLNRSTLQSAYITEGLIH